MKTAEVASGARYVATRYRIEQHNDLVARREEKRRVKPAYSNVGQVKTVNKRCVECDVPIVHPTSTTVRLVNIIFLSVRSEARL